MSARKSIICAIVNRSPIQRFLHLLSTRALYDVLLVCRLASAICHDVSCVNYCSPTPLKLEKLYKSSVNLRTQISMLASSEKMKNGRKRRKVDGRSVGGKAPASKTDREYFAEKGAIPLVTSLTALVADI